MNLTQRLMKVVEDQDHSFELNGLIKAMAECVEALDLAKKQLEFLPEMYPEMCNCNIPTIWKIDGASAKLEAVIAKMEVGNDC